MSRKIRPFTSALLSWGAPLALLAVPSLLVGARPPAPAAPDPARVALEKRFTTTVKPFLKAYCIACHSGEKPQAQLDLSAATNLDQVLRNFPHWSLTLERLHAQEMPPADFGKKPTAAQRGAVMAWIQAVREYEIRRHAGDPGPVPARRLSNAEYDATIRDLTGVDLRPTREFPVDPANQEGFDNTGESLTLSPSLTKKYLLAAKAIADNLVPTSTGLAFAPHPTLAETDRDKYCVLQIVDFYHRQPTDLAAYFLAAWRYRHRAALGMPDATRATIATDAQISPRYLESVWKTLSASEHTVGPIATLRKRFAELPVPQPGQRDAAREGCVALRDWTRDLRKKIAWRFGNVSVPAEFSAGGYCNILWKDRLYATHRRSFNPSLLQIGGVPALRPGSVRASSLGKVEETAAPVPDPVDPDLFAPQEEAERAPYLASFSAFSGLFPDAFYIDERGLMESDGIYQRSGRLLTGGTHNATSYFRDDAPLMELILDEKGQKELDALWRTFAIVASFHERMYLQGIFYERNEAQTILVNRDPEFNFARSEDRACASPEQIQRFCDLYLAKARRKGATAETLAVFEDYFKRAAEDIQREKRDRVAAEPVHRNALLDFASQAYRRPLTASERTELLGFYTTLRQKAALSHEDAVRDTVVRILMSPHFLYRLDLEASAPPPAATRTPAATTRPLSDWALASRLSYFLWSSMPDATLRAHAARGDLHRPEVLTAQARRMLKDPKARALATDFGGSWLDFRRFEEHNAVDRERFSTFDDTLRTSMFEEPVRFLLDTFQNDRSILDLLYGKHTFVNGPLARHYEMDDLKLAADDAKDWVRVDAADRYGRGGLLPMAVFLTQNSPGLRTSPVKRGYWVVRRVLGERIPPPPAVVPELPADEVKMDQPLRVMLAQHRNNPACAGCHARFDAYGLVFEGFDPIGKRRTKDMGGKPVDFSAPFPDGSERVGMRGLQEMLHQKREKDFIDNFCRKLLSYGLGRTLLPSDEPTLTTMRQRLAGGGYRFTALVDTIVTSRQFRNRRAAVTLAKD
jgi:hypothetical protein